MSIPTKKYLLAWTEKVYEIFNYGDANNYILLDTIDEVKTKIQSIRKNNGIWILGEVLTQSEHFTEEALLSTLDKLQDKKSTEVEPKNE